MQSFTEQLYHALRSCAAMSQETGLTANELADKYSFDRKMTSTVLGNIHRKKLANRALEQKVEGLRGEYRYWLVKGAEKKAIFHGYTPKKMHWKTRQALEQKREQNLVQRVERRLEERVLSNGSQSYTMHIEGPHDFRMTMTVEPQKLSGVIAAANGG